MTMMQACGSDRVMTITSLNKTNIFSPNFPKHYPENMNCSWSIVAQEDEIIELTLEDNAYELEHEYENNYFKSFLVLNIISIAFYHS